MSSKCWGDKMRQHHYVTYTNWQWRKDTIIWENPTKESVAFCQVLNQTIYFFTNWQSQRNKKNYLSNYLQVEIKKFQLFIFWFTIRKQIFLTNPSISRTSRHATLKSFVSTGTATLQKITFSLCMSVTPIIAGGGGVAGPTYRRKGIWMIMINFLFTTEPPGPCSDNFVNIVILGNIFMNRHVWDTAFTPNEAVLVSCHHPACWI